MSRRVTIFLLLTTCVLVRDTTAACYFRNGTANPSPDYSPCSTNTSNPLHTVCCARWDTCLPNGLCQSYDKVIWRETCTKSNWNKGGCQDLCSNERESQKNDNINVTPCDGTTNSTTWCCGNSNDCCTDGSGLARYTLAARFGDAIPTPLLSSAISSSSATATSTRSIATAPSTLATSSTTSTVGDGLSTGAKVGVGVGSALRAIALAALGILISKALQWRRAARAQVPPYSHPENYAPAEVYQYQPGAKPAQLAGMESAVFEMPGSRHTSEVRVSSSAVA